MNFSKEINELYSIYANKPETKQCYQDLSRCFCTFIADIAWKTNSFTEGHSNRMESVRIEWCDGNRSNLGGVE